MTLTLLLTLATSTSFVIEPPACPPDWFDAEDLERMLLADTSSVGRVYVAVIVPRCEQPDLQVAVLRAGHTPRQADVSLADVPAELALRTVALTVGDLLDGAELAGPPTPFTPEVERAPPKKVPPPRFGVEAAGEVGAYPGVGTLLYGGGARVALRPGSLFLFALGARILTTRAEETFGSARLIHFSAEGLAGVRTDAVGFEWFAGAYVDAGWATLSGATGDHRRAILRAAAALAVRRVLPFGLDLGLELRPGATIRGARGVVGEQVSVAADGAFVDARVSVGYRLPFDP
ncbi:MAG: hypothetical protein RMA76_25640 [Deltaproteobacteria bacterium]|jgi:hypothetical protein